MQVSIRLLIECMHKSYRQQVLPQVNDPTARSYANVIASFFDQLENRLELEESLLHEELLQLHALLGDELVEAAIEKGAMLSRLEGLADKVEELRARVCESYAGRFDAPEMRTYIDDQLARGKQLYAARASDKVY